MGNSWHEAQLTACGCRMVTKFHNEVLDLAVRINESANGIYEGQANDIVHDAIFVMNHDAICVHRAIGQLVTSGWPAPAAALVRTLLDLAVSAVALDRSRDRTVAAFRYMYSGLRNLSRDASFSRETRQDAFRQVRDRLKLIPEVKHPELIRVIKEKSRAYWFSPEWPNPSEVLGQEVHQDLARMYRLFSSVAHGGYLGMRIFKEDPDHIGVNPETPPGPRAANLDLTSCRVLLPILGLRVVIQSLPSLLDEVRGLTERIDKAAVELSAASP